MDISDIKNFFNYQPILEDHPQFLVDQITFLASQYLKPQELKGVQDAYEFALASHEGGIRLSGEPYIVHPLKATLFLMEIKPDLATIQTCILHDVIEDTDITFEDINRTFGKEVATLCDGMVKVSKIRYQGEDRQLETLKKTFLAMSKDLRVIFVKFADRIHNIQTLHYHPKQEKRERIAQETLKIYVPIARRLGLYQFQVYLENGAFKILHPNAFDTILSYLEKEYGTDQHFTQKGIDTLTELLHREGIKKFEVKGRLKSPYRIYEKLDHKYKGFDLGEVMDILAFRVITGSVGDCYNILGVIQNAYTPLMKKIKDYIALPKSNGYKSLHTTVMGMFDFPVEIQIRTEEMDEISEYGVAAHVGYKENGRSSNGITEQQAHWIKKLKDIVKTYSTLENKEDFKNELNVELLERNIFVYTPKGDLVELPGHSTVLDFAFRIHSDVGLKFKTAFVNGVIKPIGHVLKTGDIVSVMTFKNKFTANKHREEFLHTPSAKGKLAKFVNLQEKGSIVKEGIQLFNKKLELYGLPKLFDKEDKISKSLKKQELDDFFYKIHDRGSEIVNIIKSYYTIEPIISSRKKKTEIINTLDITIDGHQKVPYILCPECMPTQNDKIIAKSGKEGFKIHTLTCKALDTLSYDKLYEAHWTIKGEKQIYNFNIELILGSSYNQVFLIITLFSDLKIPIKEMHVEQDDQKNIHLKLLAEIINPNKVSFLLTELKNISFVRKIVKKNLE